MEHTQMSSHDLDDLETAALARPPVATRDGTFSRRQLLSLIGSSVAVAAGCGSDDGEDAGDDAVQESRGTLEGAWASGGTRTMAASYPDPFSEPLGSACTVTCRSTIGPCYASTLARRDISEGMPGLPVRLSLLIVDADCRPIAGAEVDIWHTRNSGAYSGDDTGRDFVLPAGFGVPPDGAPADAPPAGAPPAGVPALDCSLGDTEARQQSFFRGTQLTDDAGRVDFDTCYPGGYSGRALHIHFTIRREGQPWVTSQLYYPEDLTREIYESHPEYVPFGQPDTINSTDGIFQGADEVLATARQADGVLLAWKTLVLRAALEDELCGSDALGAPPPAG
jgi:protocatechuate 3,4-dioxygenase beta subunit